MRLQSFGLSHIGHVRSQNDDCFAELLSHSFFVLADGVGSMKGGGVAARLAVQHLMEEIKRNPLFQHPESGPESFGSALEIAIYQTHDYLWGYSQKNNLKGVMGTTLVCLLFIETHCFFAYIGDSRIYLLRQGKLQLLSYDDSLVFDLVHYGLIKESEAKNFPLKHIITKSLGSQPDLNIHYHLLKVEKGDLFLLCSDGISGLLETDILKQILLKNPDSLQKKAQALEASALAAGGFDNITSLLVQIL